MAYPSLEPQLLQIAGTYGLPDQTLAVFQGKNVHSTATIAQFFEDDDTFVEFFASETATGALPRALQMALRLVYHDAVRTARASGTKPKAAATNSPPTPASPASSAGKQDEVASAASEDEESGDGGDVAAPTKPGGQPSRTAWRP
mmetsp:Transcript_33329/g.75992  ORF Transcript_33329/g.75992 Transcript_33329/m.75992 type:complete len:145 (-) Transcript_33329:76-510(-)